MHKNTLIKYSITGNVKEKSNCACIIITVLQITCMLRL